MARVPRVIVVAGPTASGKSALALCLSEALDHGVIINADSIQCYRDLPTLTARPSAEDERRAPHRLYAILGPDEMLSATAWAAKAGEDIKQAIDAGRQPIVAGGSGFYLKALMEGLADIPPVPAEIRTQTQELLTSIGAPALHEKLKARDPLSAARIKPTDKQRIARAWEVMEATDTPLSTWQSQPTTPPLEAEFIALLVQPPREVLYQACDERFQSMLDRGAVGEVENLLKSGASDLAPVMRALGAQDLVRHIRGEITREEAATRARAATRQYAKRQSTWFRHQFHADYRLETKFSESLFHNFFPEIRRMLLT